MEKDKSLINPILDAFEEYRCDDDLIAAAYAGTSSQCRALIKTGIALAFFHFHNRPTCHSTSISDYTLGFSENIKTEPVNWTAIIIGKSPGAARVAAAVLLPTLAHVPAIYAICIAKPDMPTLVALELCGIEDIYVVNQNTCSDMIEKIGQVDGSGRIFNLAGEYKPNEISESNPEIFLYGRKPNIICANDFNPDAIEFCLGQTPVKIDLENMDNSCHWDAIYTRDIATYQELIKKLPIRLHIAQGCEGFWLYESMRPENFLKCHNAVTLIQRSDQT